MRPKSLAAVKELEELRGEPPCLAAQDNAMSAVLSVKPAGHDASTPKPVGADGLVGIRLVVVIVLVIILLVVVIVVEVE